MRRSLLASLLVLLLAGCLNTAPHDRPDVTPEIQINTGALSSSATIVANAQSQPELSQLVGALRRAGLVDALSGPGPYTVFAPINEAFNDIDMNSMSREQLAEVLKYHVVEGDIALSSLVDGTVLGTMAGENITVTLPKVNNASVMLDAEATVIYPDIRSSNGRIHLINAVLTPQADGTSSVE